MKIDTKNQIIIDVISTITEGTPEEHINAIPLLCLREGHFEVANIKIFEGIGILKQLSLDKYIQKLRKPEINQMLESLRLGLEQNRQQQIDEGKITAEDVLQEGKNLLEDKQIDVNTVIPETLEEAENFTLTVDILEETIINNRSDIPKETINKILHSDSIGYYVMTKNLLRLKFMIEQGHDYYSLDHSLPLETTTFDSETSLLKIRNYPPFEVSKNKDDYNASHLILKYIFNHGSNNTHFYVDMYDSGLFSTHDDYNKEQHSEKYRNTCNYLNGKIQPE